MPPKRRPKGLGAGNSSDLFSYNNKVELTFKSQPKEAILAQVAQTGDSSDSDDSDDSLILRKKGKKNADTSSSESSPASDSEVEDGMKKPENATDNVYEVPDDSDDVGPRPLTPPPNIQNIAASGFRREAMKLTKSMGEKMRYLQYLQTAEQDTPSPVTGFSDVVVVQEGSNYGTPTSVNRKMTIRIRTRNGVERFPLKRNETFEEIFSELAKKHNVEVDALSLSFTDTQGNFQTLKGNDTPNSVNLGVADIIECVVVHSVPLNESFENSENIVNIKIQGSEKNTIKQFKAIKNEPLGKIMQQYADFRQLPLSQLKFMFDGETMTSEQSPDDLDMDDDNVVDVQKK